MTLPGIVSEKQVNYIVKPIVFIVLSIVAYVLIKKAITAYKLRKVGRATYDANDLNPAINYDNIVAALHKALYSGIWVFKDTGSIEKQAGILMTYSDNELKYIYSRYDELFGKGETTLYSDFDIFCLTCPNISSLLKRFERLGLN